jgi:uncharacterized membrane protein YeaQ/YmgE (transglycosylase-associated protein family)
MWFLITFLFVGFVAGLLARALVSGPAPSGCLPTTLLGVVGSFIGGFLGYVLFGKDLDEGSLQVSGIFGSVIGSMIALMVYKRTLAR